MLPACPLPRPELSAADWQAYFQRLYGRSGGNNLPSPVGIDDANFPSPDGVDVLNLTLLSNVTVRGVLDMHESAPRPTPPSDTSMTRPHGRVAGTSTCGTSRRPRWGSTAKLH